MAATVTVVDVTVAMETEVVMVDVIRRIFAVLHRIGTAVNPPAEVQQRIVTGHIHLQIYLPMRINSQIFKMEATKKDKLQMTRQI
jgi:hypothetical protein